MNPTPAPGSQASLREMNRLRVLDAVRTNGALTQVEIAEVTGLSAATVSNLVRELDATAAVVLAPSIRNGRRAVLVSLAAPEGLLAAVAFGDRDVRVAVGQAPDQITRQQRLPLPADHAADEGLSRAGRLLGDLLEQAGHTLSELRAVGVGLPAPIDSVSGQVGADGVLPGWRGVDLVAEVQAALHPRAAVDNTANLAALGELTAGALQGVRTGIFLRVSYGVGAGIVIDGEVFRGSTGTAGEIGHVTVDEKGPVCRCGNRGCLDTYVGAAAVLGALRASHGPLTLRDVIARALDGDPGCRRILEDAGHHLGVAVAGVVNLLNPQAVVVGGQVARVGEILLSPMRDAIDRGAIPSAAHSLQVRIGSLDEQADLVGALVVAERLRREGQEQTLAVS